MFSTDTLAIVYLVTGFTVGFGHCIGMCGPIVVSFSLGVKNQNIYLSQGLYHAGRVLTYMMLGGIMGATGSFTAVTAHMAGIQKSVFIFAGLLVIVMGLAMTGWMPLGSVFADAFPSIRFISSGYKKLLSQATLPAFIPLGLLLGLLPCGPVYTALIGVARIGMESQTLSGGVLTGMGLMSAFGIGTVPALLLVARLADMKWLKNRQLIYRFGGVMMVLMGALLTIRAIRF